MLQRKQTLFLLLAVVCGILTFVFPVDTFQRGGEIFVFRTTGLFAAGGTPVADASPKVPFAVLLGLSSAALAVSIFFFRNRPRQMLFVRSIYLLLLAVIAFLFITDTSITAYLEKVAPVQHQRGAASFLLLAMLVLAVLAERAIRKDEALVKSADRLR